MVWHRSKSNDNTSSANNATYMLTFLYAVKGHWQVEFKEHATRADTMQQEKARWSFAAAAVLLGLGTAKPLWHAADELG